MRLLLVLCALASCGDDPNGTYTLEWECQQDCSRWVLPAELSITGLGPGSTQEDPASCRFSGATSFDCYPSEFSALQLWGPLTPAGNAWLFSEVEFTGGGLESSEPNDRGMMVTAIVYDDIGTVVVKFRGH